MQSETADIDGAFPDAFYSTTNQETQIRCHGEWITVDDQEMDCGISVNSIDQTARCIPMTDVRKGMQVVVGYAGIRVRPYERQTDTQAFEFMNSSVSTEKPKGIALRQVAQQLFNARSSGGRTAVVGGPAIVHTGSHDHLAELIRRNYVDVLLAGNALAVHDMECSLFGTSLGIDLDEGNPVEAGHEHHLRYDQSHSPCRRHSSGR